MHNGDSVFSHDLLNLAHHPIQLVDEIGMVAIQAKCDHKGSVVPKRAILFPLNRLNTSRPCLRNSARIARVLCNLSDADTSRVEESESLRCSM